MLKAFWLLKKNDFCMEEGFFGACVLKLTAWKAVMLSFVKMFFWARSSCCRIQYLYLLAPFFANWFLALKEMHSA